MNKFLFILLFPILMVGQGGIPPVPTIDEYWLVSFDSVQKLVDDHGFVRRQAASTSKKIMTTAEAKAHLWLNELYTPILSKANNQGIPRYALEPANLAPTLSVSSIGTTSVTLTWTDPISGAISGSLEYARQGIGQDDIWSTNTQSATPPRIISGLVSGATYKFRYRASYPDLLYGPYSNIVTVTTNTTIPTGSIIMQNLRADITGNLSTQTNISLIAEWDSPIVSGSTSVTGYELIYYLNGNATPITITGIAPSALGHTVSGITAPITNFIWVRATGTNGINSEWVSAVIGSTSSLKYCGPYANGTLVTGIKTEARWQMSVIAGAGIFRIKVDPYLSPGVRLRVWNTNNVLLGDTKYISGYNNISYFVQGYGTQTVYWILDNLCGVDAADINLKDYTGYFDDQNTNGPLGYGVILTIDKAQIINDTVIIQWENPLYLIRGTTTSAFLETDCP